MNNLLSTEEQSLHVPPPPASRIRSHALKPQHSRLDYERRKSSTDASSTIVPYGEPSTDGNELEEDERLTSSKRPSLSWFKRRFTLFSVDQPIQEKRRMTTDRFSFFNHRSCSDMLKEKRPSAVAQMLESFVRRISSRKKKHHYDREEDEIVIDPVYETLKVAAETRKRTLANYIQQRQLSLNKQTSLTSQGSLELDTQPSPGVPRYKNRIDNDMASSSSSQQQQQQGSSSSGKQNSIVKFSPVVETHQPPMRYESYKYL